MVDFDFGDGLKAAVRDAAFSGLDGLPRFQRLRLREVCRCDFGGEYDVEDCGTEGLDDGQLETLRLLAERAPAGAQIVVRRHTCECSLCGGQKARNSAMVRLTWEGQPLSREYDLGA